MTSVKAEDIETLVQVFDESDWEELRVVLDGLEIYLSRNPADRDRHRHLNNAISQTVRVQPVTSTEHRPLTAPSGAKHASVIPAGMVAIKAPNLGTFYRAPKPGSPPYVTIGQEVEPETEMCLLEVMKLFTSVRAGITGIVREVFVEDAQLVEFEQPLFLVEPSE